MDRPIVVPNASVKRCRQVPPCGDLHFFLTGWMISPVSDVQALQNADDARLMARSADGDRSAFAELIQRHQRRVFELAYRTTVNAALAEDITQEAFLRVWRSADRYQPSARFGTWLYRIVVNLCLDEFKKKKPFPGEIPDQADVRTAHPGGVLEADERALAVRRAVADLPERQRIAVLLHRFMGLPTRDVAEATGWTESAAESLLVRAYAALRKSLADLIESG
jgi:RNA polymerase sigma-70 factor (ECF subfamily)